MIKGMYWLIWWKGLCPICFYCWTTPLTDRVQSLHGNTSEIGPSYIASRFLRFLWSEFWEGCVQQPICKRRMRASMATEGKKCPSVGEKNLVWFQRDAEKLCVLLQAVHLTMTALLRPSKYLILPPSVNAASFLRKDCSGGTTEEEQNLPKSIFWTLGRRRLCLHVRYWF